MCRVYQSHSRSTGRLWCSNLPSSLLLTPNVRPVLWPSGLSAWPLNKGFQVGVVGLGCLHYKPLQGTLAPPGLAHIPGLFQMSGKSRLGMLKFSQVFSSVSKTRCVRRRSPRPSSSRLWACQPRGIRLPDSSWKVNAFCLLWSWRNEILFQLTFKSLPSHKPQGRI